MKIAGLARRTEVVLRLLVLVLLVVLVSIPNCSGDEAPPRPDDAGPLAGRSVVVIVDGGGPAGSRFASIDEALCVRVDEALSPGPKNAAVAVLTGTARAGRRPTTTLAELFRAAGHRTVALVHGERIGERSLLDRGVDRVDVVVTEDEMIAAVEGEARRASSNEPVFVYVRLDVRRDDDVVVRRLVDAVLTRDRRHAFAVLVTATGRGVAERVPWILRADGAVPAGRVVAGPVALADTLPTLVDLCGLERPRGTIDGRSFATKIVGGDDSSEIRAVSERVDLEELGYGDR